MEVEDALLAGGPGGRGGGVHVEGLQVRSGQVRSGRFSRLEKCAKAQVGRLAHQGRGWDCGKIPRSRHIIAQPLRPAAHLARCRLVFGGCGGVQSGEGGQGARGIRKVVKEGGCTSRRPVEQASSGAAAGAPLSVA